MSLEQRIIAIGDIHGCCRTFEKLLNTIQPKKTDTILLLGDYIDRGPSSKEVIDLILSTIEAGFEIIPLMGNHESMLLGSLENPRSFSSWMYNGGAETLKSFNIEVISKLPEKYVIFFKNLGYYWVHDQYHFVHAGFTDDNANQFADTTAMLWSRKENYSSSYFEDKYIIHGHTPITTDELTRALANKSTVINIDTGCVYKSRNGMGILSAIEFPSTKNISVRNCDM